MKSFFDRNSILPTTDEPVTCKQRRTGELPGR
jgi:hypothetical protein